MSQLLQSQIKDVVLRTFSEDTLLTERVLQEFADAARIKSGADLVLYLLQGKGLAPSTKKSYGSHLRGFFEYWDNLHPFQIEACHVEQWYDDARERCDITTCRNKVSALKAAFGAAKERWPVRFNDPFASMDADLLGKLNKAGHSKIKGSLTKPEARRLLGWLREDDPCNAARIMFLIGTGLRADELCSLRWKDIEQDEESGTWYANGIGKGGKDFRQEIALPEAIELARRCQPGGAEDPIFRSPADSTKALKPAGLWFQVRKVGERAVKAGIIKANRKLTWSPHLFRRSFATILYREGMDLKALQAQTRHAGVEVLMKHYVVSDTPSSPIMAQALGVAT